MLGQYRGDIRMEMGRVVEVFDVGAVHAENVVDSASDEVLDDVIDHSVFPGHLLT